MNKMQDITRELNYLSSVISQLLVAGSETKYMAVSNTILNLMVKEYDLSPLADQIIKLLALPHPPVKRIVCSYLRRYALSVSNLNILSTNCFLKDFEDPNPYVRRLVIKTVCHLSCLHELAYQLLPLALCDTSSYVRCTAASSCTLVINEQNLESLQNIIDKLYNMIRDPDPSVVSASLDALDVILRSEGGVVINTRLSHYLISRIDEFREWHFAIVSRVLKKYLPKDVDELIMYLNALDQNLSNSNILNCNLAADLALFYISNLEQSFSADVIEQISPQLKFLLHHSSDELLYEIISVIKKHLISHENYLTPFYKLLFCRFSDSIFVKIRKLQIIVDFGTSSNVSEITDELLLCCCNNVKEVAIQSVSSFIKFILIHSVDTTIMKSFVLLMDIQFNNLNEEILVALCSSRVMEKDYFRTVFLSAISKKSSRITSVPGKLALLKLIANYGKYIEESPYVIEDFMNDPQNLENESIVLMIVTASVQLFLLRPAEMQLLLGRILQFANQSDNIIFKKQSSIYNHLLSEKGLNKEVLLTSQSEISQNSD